MDFFYTVLVWFLLYVMNSCISPASAYLSEVIDLVTVHTLLPIGQPMSWWMAGTTITTAFLCRCSEMCLPISHIVFESPFAIFTLSNSFVLLKLAIIADWALWALTLFVQPNTCSLIMSALSLALVSSLIISVTISLSLIPCMNCSFNCLSTSQ